MPSSDDGLAANFVSIWPADAYSNGVNGHVTLSCWIDVHGLAEQCEVLSETPRTAGLGKAALLLRPTFRLTPAQGPDGPVASTMTIGVTFTPPNRSWNYESSGRRSMVVHSFQNPLSLRPTLTMLDHPVWIAAPNFDDLAHAYPARGGGAEGYAVGHCEVERSGALSRCSIVVETPRNQGFGAAALSLTAKFRLADNLSRPRRSEDLWVDIPIRMTPPSADARTVTAPIWLVGFDPAQAPRLFPPEAVAKGLTTGRGIARCTVAADGSLTGCAPDGGDPPDLGFSEAAARLASTLRMNLWSADGAPVEGGVIRVPIRLNLQSGPSQTHEAGAPG
jgi:TonB family protein